MSEYIRKYRKWGYDVLINHFEDFLKDLLANKIIFPEYGNDWKRIIPVGVIEDLEQDPNKEVDFTQLVDINEFVDFLNFPHYKEIFSQKEIWEKAKPYFGSIEKTRFIQKMSELNKFRKKIAHAKNFTSVDFDDLCEILELLLSGEDGKELVDYIHSKSFQDANEIPESFTVDHICPNNLPAAEYEDGGGFVGRDKEIEKIKQYLLSKNERIVTITGAGGVGKTAIAQKIAFDFLLDDDNPFEAIAWFSAKKTALSEKGIFTITPTLTNYEQLLSDMMRFFDEATFGSYKLGKVPIESYREYLLKLFDIRKFLIIIDNLETILQDKLLIDFIKEIPFPTKTLITSRMGLGEIERKYPIGDMKEKDAMRLFRIYAKEKNNLILATFPEPTILNYVTRVRCYPLIIKWAIGRVCNNGDIEKAFSEITVGDSEIAKFCFDDVFNQLSLNSKTCLYAVFIHGNRPISKYALLHLANINDDQFEVVLTELSNCSLISSSFEGEPGRMKTLYKMNDLVKGFIEEKLNDDENQRNILANRYHDLSLVIEELEKSESSLIQSRISFGIRTLEDQVAFNHVKTAKNLEEHQNYDAAAEKYKDAIKIAPKLSYAYTEYSKFELKRQFHTNAINLAEQAVKEDPNLHSWLNLGFIYRKTAKIRESIDAYLKALDLDPTNPLVFIDLGRSYTFNEEFEKAEEQFIKALEKSPDSTNKRNITTLRFHVENYKRWAEKFGKIGDLQKEIEKLEIASKRVFNLLELDFSLINVNLWREINLELGIAYAKKENLKAAEPYFKNCLYVEKEQKRKFYPSNEIVAATHYYLAIYSSKEKKPLKEILEYIEEGLSYCPKDCRYFSKLENLKKDFSTKISGKKKGTIKFFNSSRKFGFILDSYIKNKEFIFFLQDIVDEKTRTAFLDEIEVHKYYGKAVTFIVQKNPRGASDRAVEIIFN